MKAGLRDPSRRGRSAPLVAALILAAAAVAAVAWAGLTYNPHRGAAHVELTVPLPPPLQQPEEPSPTAAPALGNARAKPPEAGGTPQAPPPAEVNPPAPAASAPLPSTMSPPAPQTAPAAPAAAPPARQQTSTPSSPAFPAGPDALAPAPDPGLSEHDKSGILPIVGHDGRKAWRVYARPFDATDPRPRIAIVISGLGQSEAATEMAIQSLPGSVTFAFNPYGGRLDYWTARARAAGHEVLLLVPMEPVNYPANDPGPETLLTTLPAAQNRERLHWSMERFAGYVGILNLAGSQYTTAAESLRPTLTEIRDRGLMFVDARSSIRSAAFRIAGELNLPRALNNRFIDVQASRADIDRRLDELVKIASTSGFAVGIGQPLPATIERVAAFVRDADSRGLAIAPVSAIADRQKE